jgi:hypothetical protein
MRASATTSAPAEARTRSEQQPGGVGSPGATETTCTAAGPDGMCWSGDPESMP